MLKGRSYVYRDIWYSVKWQKCHSVQLCFQSLLGVIFLYCFPIFLYCGLYRYYICCIFGLRFWQNNIKQMKRKLYSICVFLGLSGRIRDLHTIKKSCHSRLTIKIITSVKSYCIPPKTFFLFVFLSGAVNSDGWNTIGEISTVVKTNRVGELSWGWLHIPRDCCFRYASVLFTVLKTSYDFFSHSISVS